MLFPSKGKAFEKLKNPGTISCQLIFGGGVGTSVQIELKQNVYLTVGELNKKMGENAFFKKLVR